MKPDAYLNNTHGAQLRFSPDLTSYCKSHQRKKK